MPSTRRPWYTQAESSSVECAQRDLDDVELMVTKTRLRTTIAGPRSEEEELKELTEKALERFGPNNYWVFYLVGMEYHQQCSEEWWAKESSKLTLSREIMLGFLVMIAILVVASFVVIVRTHLTLRGIEPRV